MQAMRHMRSAVGVSRQQAGHTLRQFQRHHATRTRTSSATAQAAAAAAEVSTSAPALGTWRPGCEIRMLYDGQCSLCMKEVNFLRKRDAAAGRIDFVDIDSPDYTAEANAGITYEQAMERIHAILPDGTIVRDVEVFRRLYEAVGLGWVYAVTKNPSVLNAANSLYGVWAKYRTQITGREALEVILQRRKAEAAGNVGGSLCRNADGSISNEACELPTAAAAPSKQQ